MKDILYPLRVLHGRIHEWKESKWPIYKLRIENPKAVFLVFTPEHGNLGDHAIAQAEKTWLDSLDLPYIEVTGKTLRTWEKQNTLNGMNGRTIFIHGGGYMGTIWPESERILLKLVSQNPGSNILALPNTFYYEQSEFGINELEKAINLYNSHRHLKIYARESVSFRAMNQVLEHAGIAPDMVLRMNKCMRGVIREGCILCLRSDREKTRSEEMETSIIRQAHALFGEHIKHLDMIVPHEIPISERDVELEKQYDAFRHAELVITDRLHGMIFCAITGTPCIVINSKSPKVRGCYEWINDLPYIRFCEDVNQISSIYRSIPKKEWTYDETRLLPRYKELEADILKAARGRMICL